MGGRAWRGALSGVAVVAMAMAAAAPAGAAEAQQELTLTTSDGVALHATVAGEAPLRPRPLVVEYSPYGQDASAHPPLGPEFNYVYVQARGTGRSGGGWDIMGDREQLDIAETLAQLCRRPFSSRRIGLYGFSAAPSRPTTPCAAARCRA